MCKNKIGLIILIGICICLSLGSVSANDNGGIDDNLTAINYLNSIESYSNDNLTQVDDSNYNSTEENEIYSDNQLGVAINDSSQDTLSSSVDVYTEHTYYKDGYTFTVSADQYEKIQYVNENKYDSPDDMDGHKVFFKVKTGEFYKYKKYIYKNVKVTKYKWAYKYVLTGKSYYKRGIYHYKSYNKVNRYYQKGWKYDSYASKRNGQGGYNDYAVVKKKVKYKATKKVKTNKYTTVKKPIYAKLETHRTGGNPMYYVVTYDFYVDGVGYIAFGGIL